MKNRGWFLSVYREHIHREDSEKILDYLLLEHSDFFRAPISTRFHDARAQGLLEHSLNVYDCLEDYLSHPRVKECYHMDHDEETIATVALLYDVYKISYYKESTRNQKVNGQWVQVPSYEYENRLLYGHGEKSAYIITGFMRLNKEEVFAIRYHMGLSGDGEVRSVDAVFEMYPPASALNTAGMEATYYLEGK